MNRLGRWIAPCAGLTAMLLGMSCNLFGPKDHVPPEVTMESPPDSEIVRGSYSLLALASDSSGVAKVEFLVDDSAVGEGGYNDYDYEYVWNSTEAGIDAWHRVSARATDSAGNVGYAETLHVLVLSPRDLDVYHGGLAISAQSAAYLELTPEEGDSLTGDARVTGGATLSDFFWCDSANYAAYRNGQSFNCFDRQSQSSEVRLAGPATVAGKYFIVLRNQTGSDVNLFVRFSLRKRQ